MANVNALEHFNVRFLFPRNNYITGLGRIMKERKKRKKEKKTAPRPKASILLRGRSTTRTILISNIRRSTVMGEVLITDVWGK